MNTTRTLTALATATLLSVTLQAGWVDAPFLRGDANRDGALDLQDAIVTLEYLFLEQSNLEETCMAAADSDGSGRIDITDAIYTLSHLYGGGAAPPLPYPEEGILPAAPHGLDCRMFESEPDDGSVDDWPDHGGDLGDVGDWWGGGWL